MQTLETAIPYLLDRGLVTMESILSGDLAVWSAARRHPNLRVERTDGPGYLVKQPDPSSNGAVATLRREAEIYRLVHRRDDPELAPVARLLPPLVDLDPSGPVLVLELVEKSRSLRELWGDLGPDAPPTAAAEAIGGALATVHATFEDDSRLADLPGGLPWVLQVHRPRPHLLSSLSPANVETLRILQTEEEMSRHLDALAPLWVGETLIHGDVKSDNLLLVETDAGIRAVLVDWELAQVGDPAWDLAGFFQDMLLIWISSMPLHTLAPGTPPEALADQAGWPLPVLQTVLRSFWRGYAREASPRPERLERTVRYSGARLVQTAYELAHDADALPAHSVLCLQVASNLLADPRGARFELYGLVEAVTW
jgi:hypothetical protein